MKSLLSDAELKAGTNSSLWSGTVLIDCLTVNLTEGDVAAVQREDFIRAAAAAALMLRLISLAAGPSLPVCPPLDTFCRFLYIRASPIATEKL